MDYASTNVSEIFGAFLKAYLGNPIVLVLLILLILAVGVSLRFRKLEEPQPEQVDSNDAPPSL
ncbi:MAG: hypothetical protein AB7E52_08215 [Bdellovibrionales bacterium]